MSIKYSKEDNEAVQWCEKKYPKLTEEYNQMLLNNKQFNLFHSS